MKLKLAVIFLIMTAAAFLGYVYAGFFIPSSPRAVNFQNFIVGRGETLFEIAGNLERGGLIRHRFFFVTHVGLRGEQKNLKAGGYKLSSSMKIKEIADIIIKGESSLFSVTIPEGWNIKQIARRLEDFGVNDFYERAQNSKKSFAFLVELPSEASLEGFLFPDSYRFFSDVEADEIIDVMLGVFEKKVVPLTGGSDKPLFEIITMASLLEKEAKTAGDKGKISDILWRRLEKRMPLELCSTVIYLTGDPVILIEDLNIDSPYNTYLYPGLPPGPIANPGLESIEAALNPEPNPYLFYLSTGKGEIIFSETIQEHNIQKAKHL